MWLSFFLLLPPSSSGKISVDALCGTSSMDSAAAIENVAAHFPAGTSVRDLIHYEQYIRGGQGGRGGIGGGKQPIKQEKPVIRGGRGGVDTRESSPFFGAGVDFGSPSSSGNISVENPFFGAYDFGRRGNEAAYNQATPPPYNLSAYKIPTALFMGSHDDLVAPTDAARLIAALPKSTVIAKKTFADFSHLTWFAGEL